MHGLNKLVSLVQTPFAPFPSSPGSPPFIFLLNIPEPAAPRKIAPVRGSNLQIKSYPKRRTNRKHPTKGAEPNPSCLIWDGMQGSARHANQGGPGNAGQLHSAGETVRPLTATESSTLCARMDGSNSLRSCTHTHAHTNGHARTPPPVSWTRASGCHPPCRVLHPIAQQRRSSCH
jgi:hypothetical protein